MHMVAVADDFMIVLVSLKMQIVPLGWQVDTFDNSIGVAFRVKHVDPDIVLLDVNMPVLTSPGLMRTLKSRMGPKKRCEFLNSDQDAAKLQKLGTETGADGYTVKTGDASAFGRMPRVYRCSACRCLGPHTLR